MPLIGPEGVVAALTVCGCTNEQRNALRGEGFSTMSDLLMIQAKDVTTMCSNLTRPTLTRGGCRIGMVVIKKIEALVNWCHDREVEGLPLDANDFNIDVMSNYVMKAQLEDAGDLISPEPPKDYKVLKWVSWAKKFETYLWQV